MKIRLSPLNLIASVLLVTALYGLFFENSLGWGSLIFLAAFAFIFVIDLLFRRILIDLKRIWLYELVFVIFVAGMIFLFRA